MAGRRLFPCLVALALVLAAPSVAQAYIQVYGSDLSAPANMVEGHGADSAFWNVSFANGGPTQAPSDGQVTSVRVKGIVLPDPTGRRHPTTMIHFQTLRPMPDGSMSVWISSGAFFVPLGGDPEQISTYHPINMCVHKGDYLDFNDIGGNEWWWGNYSGMPFQTFSRVPGSAVDFYTKNAGTNNGSRWKPMLTKPAEELLMQMKLNTGPDATDICPGGYMQHRYRGVDLRNGQEATVSGGAARLRVNCHYKNFGGCGGTARATATVNGRRVSVGSGKFWVCHGCSGDLNLSLSSAGVQAVRRARALRVRLTAVSHDNPRGDSRARWGSERVQTRANAATVTLRAG
jgi:hypothetical protein